MSKLGFSGYYGMSNYGDDLFAWVSALGSRHYWPEHEGILLGPRAIGAPGTYSSSFGWIPLATYQRSDALGKIARLCTLLGGSLLLDKFIFSGGSLFHSRSSGIYDLLYKLGRARTTRFSAIGVSIGPFADTATEKKTIESLRSFEYISVRDRASFDIAASFALDVPLNYGGDLAGIYPMFDNAADLAGNKRPKLIGFSPCALPGDPASARMYCDFFVDQMSKLASERGYSACLINLNQHSDSGDAELCAYTAAQLTAKSIPYALHSYQELGVPKTWGLISSLSAYMTVRLHGALTAFVTNTPFFLFEYHRKCTDFLEEINHPLRGFEIPMHGDRSCDTDLLNCLLAGDSGAELSVVKYCAKSASNFTSAPWFDPRP